jgi:glycolate oxidase
VEKIGLVGETFSPDEIAAMADVKAAFNPDGLCNPHKVFPTDRRCIEVLRPRPRGGG